MFLKLFREGPNFVCIICNRCFYQKFDQSKSSELFLVGKLTGEISNKDMYICLTYYEYLRKRKILPKAVWNKLEVYNGPNILTGLNMMDYWFHAEFSLRKYYAKEEIIILIVMVLKLYS